MAGKAINLDKVSAQRLLTKAIVKGDHETLTRIVGFLGDPSRQVVTISGQKPDAVDRFLAYCADLHMLTDREILEYSILNSRVKRAITATKQAHTAI